MANSPPDEEVAAGSETAGEVVVAAPASPSMPASLPAADSTFDPLFSVEPQAVDPRHVTVTRLGSWIVSGFFILGGLVAMVVVAAVTWPPGLPALVALVGWIALTMFFTWLAHVWPVIVYRRLRYIVTEQGLEIRRGVIWKVVISMPQSRVQHTDVVQGPIQRRFGVATLVAHTAGTRNATVSLEGLSHQRAMQIRDFLLQGGSDDSV